MEVKLFEVRDRHTFLPVCAIRLTVRSEAERWLCERVGYDLDFPDGYFLLFKLDGGRVISNPWCWYDRTMRNAHLFISHHFAELTSGDTIDVEFILGESAAPKPTERGG